MINNGRLIFLLNFTLLITFAFILTPFKASGRSVKRIGIVFDGPSERNKQVLSFFEEEITDVAKIEFDVRFPTNKILDANWTYSGVKAAVDQLLYDPGVDMVLALGVIGSSYVTSLTKLPKPVVAPFLLDSEVLILPINEEGASGVTNLNYISPPSRISNDLSLFHELVPFTKLAFFIMPGVIEAKPELRNVVRDIASKIGFEVVFIPVSNSAQTALSSIPEDVQAVYLSPLPSLSRPEFKLLLDGLIDRRLPSFSAVGKDEVEQGVLLGLRPDEDLKRIARRTALNILDIFIGKNAGTLEVAFPLEERLSINLETAAAIGFYPKFRVRDVADLIGEEVIGPVRKLSLREAVDRAVEANLDLLAAERAVAAGQQEVNLALSDLLPQSGIAVDGQIIDKQSADVSLGRTPERTITGRGSLSQVIYSEKIWANYSVQRHLQDSRKSTRDQIQLDIIFASAVAYLRVLKNKTFNTIQKDNLKLTERNLQLAKDRVLAGVATRAEVFRWDSEVSQDRINLADIESEARKSEIFLNRLLQLPLGEGLILSETGLDDPVLIFSDPRFSQYIDNAWSSRIFGDFLVGEAFTKSPLIQNLDFQIKAQERIITSTNRAFWQPDLNFIGSLSKFFAEGGAGQTGQEIVLGDTTIQGINNDLRWQILFSASFPLTRGGAKIFEYKQARQELYRLRYERGSTAQEVEDRVRSALQNVRASYPTIQFSRDSADAANKNLDLVTDQYRGGVVSIVDLIDAQNRALSANLLAATAVYDFIIDLVAVQFAVGKFNFFATKEEKEEWFRKLEEFFNEAGEPPAIRTEG